jgi:hypothetical protein
MLQFVRFYESIKNRFQMVLMMEVSMSAQFKELAALFISEIQKGNLLSGKK